LRYVGKYILKKNAEALTANNLVIEIQRRYLNLKNSRLPDIQELFTREFKMDLNGDDIEARILNYFVLFEKIMVWHQC